MHPDPYAQLLLLRTLSRVLPRLKRKRTEFIATCLSSLRARYLDGAWPGATWDDMEGGDSPADRSVPPSEHVTMTLPAR